MNKPLKVLDLFSGIGGFSLGLERTGGFQTVAFCEIEDFPRRVLAKHWPGVPIYDDVRTLTAERLAADGIAVDVICGGFPCQDVSHAGRQAGIRGERSGLWGELLRLAGELRPEFVIVENVANLIAGERGAWFGRVVGDLAEIGFDAEWHCIPAAHVGAPHIRDRVWIVAQPQHPNTDSAGPYSAPGNIRTIEFRDGQGGDTGSVRFNVADANSYEPNRRRGNVQVGWGWFARQVAEDGHATGTEWRSEPNVGRVAHGVPSRVDRLRALGNAVVPQIPELIGRAILQARAA